MSSHSRETSVLAIVAPVRPTFPALVTYVYSNRPEETVFTAMPAALYITLRSVYGMADLVDCVIQKWNV